MTPEILHRCDSCGAVIREPAMFCPECGKTLAAASADPQAGEVAATAPAVAENSDAPVAASAEHATVMAEPPGNSSAPVQEETPAAVVEKPGARERTRETLHRAGTAARGAIERPVKQVEKIHHVSSVMFEEAHYDPSLRFVLVALGLFIVFIILLVLSKVMG